MADVIQFGEMQMLTYRTRELGINYIMGDAVLCTTVKENDLGITISADVKVSEQLQRVIQFLG